MAKAIEYKMDANSEGNAVVPGFISRRVNGKFVNNTNHTMIGLRLADWVKVPDSVTQMTRAELKVRNRAAGLTKLVDGEPVAMSDAECDEATDAFCDEHGIA
jgi:hypothetical protein